MWGWGGGKNWASSFRVILGFLVVSLQFEPADARVLVEHPVPRCPSCTPVLFGVHVNIFSHSLLEYFQHSDIRTEFLH